MNRSEVSVVILGDRLRLAIELKISIQAIQNRLVPKMSDPPH
jgi:hypothetical protein